MPIGLYPDRVKEALTSASTGPTTLTLNGAATGYKAFSSAGIPSGASVDVCIAMDDGSAWEVCEVTISGSTVTVGTVYSNSSGTTSALTFATGAKSIWVTLPGEDIERFQTMGHITARVRGWAGPCP